MADKQKLHDMLDALTDKKGEEAQVSFHGYAQEKMKELIHPTVEDDLTPDFTDDDGDGDE